MKTFKETFILLIGAILFLSFKISAQTNNRDIIKGMYDSFSTGNVPAVLDAMDQKIVWNSAENYPYADGSPYVGPTAVLEGVFIVLAVSGTILLFLILNFTKQTIIWLLQQDITMERINKPGRL